MNKHFEIEDIQALRSGLLLRLDRFDLKSRQYARNAIVLMILETGMRTDEAAQIKKAHILWDKNCVMIVRASKGSRSRVLELSQECMNHLRRVARALKAQDEFVVAAGYPAIVDYASIKRQLRQEWKELVDQVFPEGERNHLGLHALRHSVCVALIKAGKTLPEVQAISGHRRLDNLAFYLDYVHQETVVPFVQSVYGIKKEPA